MTEPDPALVAAAEADASAFVDALWLEEGLSRNTLESYRRDLAGFSGWLEQSGLAAAQQPAVAPVVRWVTTWATRPTKTSATKIAATVAATTTTVVTGTVVTTMATASTSATGATNA